MLLRCWFNLIYDFFIYIFGYSKSRAHSSLKSRNRRATNRMRKRATGFRTLSIFFDMDLCLFLHVELVLMAVEWLKCFAWFRYPFQRYT